MRENQEDPWFDIYLRSADPGQITDWQNQWLQSLFGQGEIIVALREGMKEYETSEEWCGYELVTAEDAADIKANGIVPYLLIDSVVLDDIEREVIIGASADKDGNLAEHGISIYLKDEKWRFEYADYFGQYLDGLDHASLPPVDPATWDYKQLFGEWVVDEAETAALWRFRGEPELGIKMILHNIKGLKWEVSEGVLRIVHERRGLWRLILGRRSAVEFSFLGAELRGARIAIKLRSQGRSEDEVWDLKYTNDRLIGQGVMRRKTVGER